MNAHATSDPYVQAALDDEISSLAGLSSGRNSGLNKVAFVLAQLGLDDQTIETHCVRASETNGYLQKDGIAQVRRTIKSGVEKGRLEPRIRSAGPAAPSGGGD